MLGNTQMSMAQLGLKAVTGLWLDRVTQVHVLESDPVH